MKNIFEKARALLECDLMQATRRLVSVCDAKPIPPGYHWRTINRAKVLLKGSEIVGGAGGKLNGEKMGTKFTPNPKPPSPPPAPPKAPEKPKAAPPTGTAALKAATEALKPEPVMATPEPPKPSKYPLQKMEITEKLLQDYVDKDYPDADLEKIIDNANKCIDPTLPTMEYIKKVHEIADVMGLDMEDEDAGTYEVISNFLLDYENKFPPAPNSPAQTFKAATAALNADSPDNGKGGSFASTVLSPEKANDFLHPQVVKVWAKATQGQKDAAYEYTRSYSKFNEPLRGIEYGSSEKVGVGNIDFENIGIGKISPYDDHKIKKGEVKKQINDLTELIDKSYYTKDITLVRGTNYDGMDRFLGIPYHVLTKGSTSELQKLLVGKHKVEQGFMSCGSSPGKGFNRNVHFNIFAPAGTKMLYVEPFSAYAKGNTLKDMNWDGQKKVPTSNLGAEQETLLQRGTKFKIKNVVRGSDGEVYIDMEVIGNKYSKI